MKTFYGISETYTGKETGKHLHINNFGYYKNVDAPITVTRPYGRPDYQLIYVKQGEIAFSSQGRIKKAASCTMLLFRPNEKQVYSYAPIPGSEYYWIHFSGTEAEMLLSGLFDREQTLAIENDYGFLDAFEGMKHFCIPYDATAAQFAEGAFIKMTAELKRLVDGSDRTMEKVINHMRTHRIKSKSNKEYAQMCGISEYHFIRRFKDFTGVSPHRYKTKLVMEQGANLLKTTDMSISHIAFTLGFEDALYFSRIFKKEMGNAPSTYRNLNRTDR